MRGQTDAVVSHYDIAPLHDIFATTQDRDLGAVSADIERVLHERGRPKGSRVTVRAGADDEGAFGGLLAGLAGAVLLIYLLIVVNFHSWRDAFVIVSGLPAALAGIVWMLFVTRAAVGAGLDRRDPVHGRRDREQHPRRDLRARTAPLMLPSPRSKPASRAFGP